MQKLFFLVTLFVTIAGTQFSFGQDKSKTAPTQLLTLYYDIKDALVGGNATIAATKAEEFVKVVNAVDAGIVNGASRDALLKDAGAISAAKDLKAQREYFSPFSNNMFVLAKTVSLSTDPVYQQYCPMKKASWLSNQKSIKNPYYGSAMLTCGKVAATL